MEYIKTWKEVMLRPSDFYRRMPTTGVYANPLTFAAINFVIFGLLTAIFYREAYMPSNGTYNFKFYTGFDWLSGLYIIYSGMDNFSFSTALTIPVIVTITGIIFIFIDAAIFYIIYKFIGGTGSYEGTVRFMSYRTAVLVFYWIPFSFANGNSFFGIISFFGLIIQIYGIYLCMVGGMFVHKVRTGKSTFTAVLGTFLQNLLVFSLSFLVFQKYLYAL